PGCIFFALKGERFNGNAFAAKALELGAAYSVIDEPAFQTDPRCLLTPNTLQALQELATLHRRSLDIPLIAIGGSNGKTTTKELVAAVLSRQYPCHFTKGNLNNQIGLPLTLLAMPPETEVAVIEMGANKPGDMTELCQIAEPTHGLLTNIGKEHLEGFGSLEGVKKSEGELYDYLRQQKGWAFVNGSEKYLKTMSRRLKRQLLYLETNQLEIQQENILVQRLPPTPFVQAAFLDENDRRVTVQSQLVGRHNFFNIMTAIALGLYFKVPGEKIKAAIETYKPTNNRSQIIRQDSNTYLLDAYNANPSSMQAALEMLAELPAQNKIAILGDMLELGESSPEEHQSILSFCKRRKIADQIVLVGPEFARTTWRKSGAHHFPDASAARAWLRAQHFEETLFLIKGSRGIRLEGLLESPDENTPPKVTG
ncbi:MAG: UDP-N-acetylmuramoyl-tripeptide--D-alanyl-D-alanine ligase, partial [Saprospiraceae bacterium]